METLYDQLKKEEKLSDLFRFLGEQQIKLQNLLLEICELCGKTTDECLCEDHC